LPFAELPELRDMVLTGEDRTPDRRALPPSQSTSQYSAVVPYRASKQTSRDDVAQREQGQYSQYSSEQQGARGGFRPTYD